MFWFPQARKTRAGTEFSPYSTISALRADAFDFAPLLAESTSREGDHQDDHEPGDDDPFDLSDPLDDIDEDYTPMPPTPENSPPRAHTPPSRSPSPPPKHRRTAFNDMQDGKAPLKGNHRRRAAKRDRQTQGQVPRPSTVHQYVDPKSKIETNLATEDLPTAHGAYAAKNGKAPPGKKKERTLPELLQLGMRLVAWNRYDPQPLVDAQGGVFAVLAGQPRDPTYLAAAQRVYALLCREGAAAAFPTDMYKHRRGFFAAINVGLSYGKGQAVPSRLRNGRYASMAERLLLDPDVKRLATFASATFRLWAPRLYEYYREHQQALHRHLPHLSRNFPKSVWSCAAFNFGPRVWTYRHRDVLNLPFGWCAVQAAGPFDATKGGHLVLWDLMLVIEFPPGALILIPSATLEHSNVPVQPGDSRVSFTQFTAGGLMRFVDNGFRTESELAAQDPAEHARMKELKSSRWEMGLSMFSTLEELLA